MKKITLSIAMLALLGINAFSAVYIKYYNKDSQKHVFVVKMDGQTKCGDVEVANDSKIEIKDGCIKFVK